MPGPQPFPAGQKAWSKASVARCAGVRVPEEDVELGPEQLIEYLAYLLNSPMRDKARAFLRDHVHLAVDLDGASLLLDHPHSPEPGPAPGSPTLGSPVLPPSLGASASAPAPPPVHSRSPLLGFSSLGTVPTAEERAMNVYQRAYLHRCESTPGSG
eukprot:RCo002955